MLQTCYFSSISDQRI